MPQGPDLFSGRRWTALAVIADACVLALAAFLAATAGGGLDDRTAHALLLTGGLVVLWRSGTRGLHGDRAGRIGLLDTIRLTHGAVGLGTATALAAAALADAAPATSRGLLLAGALAAVLLPLARTVLGLVRTRARTAGRSGRTTLVVGAGRVGASLERRLRVNPDLGLRPVGFLDDDPGPGFVEEAGRGPLLGTLDDLEHVVATTRATHVVIAFTHAPDSRVRDLLQECEALDLEVSVVPRFYENVNDRLWVEHVGGLPICGLRTVHPHAWQFAVKHVLGRLVAIAAVLAAAPLLGALALAVRLTSPGPVLYRQRRVGRDGQVFDILKFRTMRVADAASDAQLRARLTAAGVGPGGVEGVDRRTPIGALLRRTSLDELPQLLNVLAGHMSLVGPRPERPEFVELFGGRIRRYDDRHRVKSGMTGWAQVNGLRGQTSLSDRIELDNWYIQNWSLWLDLKILLLTPLEVLRSRAESGGGPAAGGAAVGEQEGSDTTSLAAVASASGSVTEGAPQAAPVAGPGASSPGVAAGA